MNPQLNPKSLQPLINKIKDLDNNIIKICGAVVLFGGVATGFINRYLKNRIRKSPKDQKNNKDQKMNGKQTLSPRRPSKLITKKQTNREQTNSIHKNQENPKSNLKSLLIKQQPKQVPLRREINRSTRNSNFHIRSQFQYSVDSFAHPIHRDFQESSFDELVISYKNQPAQSKKSIYHRSISWDQQIINRSNSNDKKHPILKTEIFKNPKNPISLQDAESYSALQQQLLKQIAQKQQILDKYIILEGLCNQQKKLIDEIKPKIQSKQDLQLFKKTQQELLVSFLDNIKKFNFNEKIPKKLGSKYHMVVGLPSVGKSSLLKKATGKNLKVGKGKVTYEVGRVAVFVKTDSDLKRTFTQIYDSPGFAKDFSLYNPKNLQALFGMDEIFIVYKDCLELSEELVRTVNAIRPQKELVLIRTHCDHFDKEDDKTCEQLRLEDKETVGRWNIPCKLLLFSSKTDENCFDNKQVIKLIKGGQTNRMLEERVVESRL